MQNQHGFSLAVNYYRRYSEIYHQLRKIIHKDAGKLVKGVCLYGKGFLQNGSHALDLLNFLFEYKTPPAFLVNDWELGECGKEIDFRCYLCSAEVDFISISKKSNMRFVVLYIYILNICMSTSICCMIE